MVKIIKKVLNVFGIIAFTISIILNIAAVLAGVGIYAYLEELYTGERDKIHIKKGFNIVKEPNYTQPFTKVVK